MKSALLVVAISFASTIVLASLGDASTIAFGGGPLHSLTLYGLISFWLGVGARNADRSDRAFQTSAWLGFGSLFLLWISPTSSSWLAKPFSELSTFLGLGLISLLFAVPLQWLGRHLCARVRSAAPGSWNQAALGVWSALVFISVVGVGPLYLLLASAGLAVLWLTPFPAPDPRILSAPHAKFTQLMPLAFILASGAFGLLWIVPHLELFDSSASNLDGLRIATMAIAALIAGALIGAPLAESHFAPIGVATLSAFLAWSWTRAGLQLDHLADENVFRMMMGNDAILSFFGLEDRLTEDHWAFAPYLVVLVGVVSVALLGGITRALFHQTLLNKEDVISAEGPISALFISIGLVLILSGIAHPWITQYRPIAAWGCALAATVCCFATCPRNLPYGIRIVITSILLAFPVIAGIPKQPTTGHPFVDNFSYKAVDVAENKSALYAPLSIVRVIERNSDKKLGNRFLAEGKNFLISNKGDDGFSARQVLLASALGNPTSRILIAGPQSPESLVTLRSVGPKEILVAASPPEIFRAMALAWNGASKDKTLDHCSSIADAEGKFGLVLIRDPVLWDGGHNLLRSAQLSIAASKVDNDGALGVLLDPERCSINLVGAIAQQLEKDLGSAAVWLVPNGWDTPGLLITGRAKRVGARLTHRVKNALIEAKLPIHNNSDLSLLQAVPKGKISELPSYSIRGPFPRFISKMQHTIWKRIEGGEPGKRAAKLLHRLMDFSEDTPAHAFLSFYSSHLGGQVYEVRDTFPGAEAWEKTELTKESLDSLFLLSKKNTNSDFLRDFWAQLTPLLVEKREVAWCFEYMSAFCDPDLFPSWGQPVFHWALGNAALEMLDYESAIAEANRILSKNRSHRRALILLAQSLSSAGRHPASANAYRKVISLEDPAPALLVALAEEELAAGLLDDARSTCAKVLEMGGESSLSKELRALMGLLPPEPIAHPEMGGPLR